MGTIPGVRWMGPLADCIELGRAVAHMFVCLGRASMNTADESDVGCLSNDEIDTLTGGR